MEEIIEQNIEKEITPINVDKTILFKNISYLLKKKNIKIRDAEKQAGVSTGYISRASKEDAAVNPTYDFVYRIAKILGVSIDSLNHVDLSGLTPTEEYILYFLDKLTADTRKYKLSWQVITKEELNQPYSLEPWSDDPDVTHDIMDMDHFYGDQNGGDYPDRCIRQYFNSRNYGKETMIKGNCYTLELQGNSKLYLMNVDIQNKALAPENYFTERELKIVKENSNWGKIIEVWMKRGDDAPKYLTDNFGLCSNLWENVDSLYKAIEEYMEHPRLDNDIMEVIDAFMNDEALKEEITDF